MTNPAAVDATPEPTVGRSTRRALLGLGVVGAALATSRSVAAAAPGPAADELASFLIGIELATRDLYRAAPEDMIDDGLPAVLARHHEAYAQRLSGIVGVRADSPNAEFFDSRSAGFEAGDPAAALEVENSLAATHAHALGQTDNATLLSAIASIVSGESRHAAVIAAESGDDLDVIITNPATPLAPEA